MILGVTTHHQLHPDSFLVSVQQGHSFRRSQAVHLDTTLRFLIPSFVVHQLLRSVLAGAEHKVGFVPDALEAHSWVQYGQTATGNDDHDAFEDHECYFVIGEQMAVETSRKLGDSVGTSDEDGESCDGKTWMHLLVT